MLLMVAAMYFSSLCAGIMTDNGGQKAANFRDGRKNMAIIAMFTATSSEKINVRKISIIVSPDRYFHVKEFHVSSLAYYGPVHWPASQRLCSLCSATMPANVKPEASTKLKATS